MDKAARAALLTAKGINGNRAAYALGGIEDMSREEFLGNPKITSNKNASDLQPRALPALDNVQHEDFPIGGLTAKYHPDGAAIFDDGKTIASYNLGKTLVVNPKYRRKGIAKELVYQWRSRYPESAATEYRTKASQAIQEAVWDRVQQEKANRIGKSAGGAMDFARHVEAVQRAGGQIAPSKYLPNVPRQVHADGGPAMFHGIHPDLQGEGGAPIDLYHGTTQDKEFEAFDNSKLGARDAGFYGRGHYLTADKVGAEEYANSGDTDGTVIGPLHTALKNPYIWDVSSDMKAHSTLRDLQSMGIMREKNKLDPWDNLQRHHIEPFMAEMQKRGHDGVLVKTDNESVPNGISEVVAFNPNTIKHKDAEVFDPNDPRIRREDGGKVAFMQGNHPLVPEVLYHGTARDIQSFDPDAKRSYDVDPSNPEKTDTGWFGKGHYFTASPKLAAHYADEGAKRQGGQGASIIPAHVAMKNPFVVDMKAYDSGAKSLDNAMSRAGVPMHPRGYRMPSEQTAALVNMGHDGVIATREGKPEEYVAFHPHQIKSAIGNQGTFDPSDPDITKAGGGSVDFVKDNPGGDWLANKQNYAFEYPRMKGIDGAITGWMGGKSDLFLPTHVLKSIEPLNNEKRVAGEPRFDDLMSSVSKEGFDPHQKGNKVVVAVNHRGKPFILEGNTRVAVAHAMGVPSVKAEVRYWNGAEEADGPMHPDKVSAMASNDPDITKAGGGDVEGGKASFLSGNHPDVPEVLYHGSFPKIATKGWTDEVDEEQTQKNRDAQDFHTFKQSEYGNFGPGIYLSDSPTVASNFAQGIRGEQTEALPHGQVFKLHVSMKKPFTDSVLRHPAWKDYIKNEIKKALWLDPTNTNNAKESSEQLFQKLDNDTATVRDLFLRDTPDGTMVNQFGQEKIHKTIRNSGFDGVIAHRPDGSKEYVAFKPEQVKSATGNQGAFDPSEPDMTKAEGGTVGKEEGGATGSLREKALWPSAQAIKAGTGSREAHAEMVNKIKPVSPYSAPVPPAPDQQVHDALTKDKQPKAFAPRQLKEGTPVAVRLDIPAYEKKNTWVVSVHHPKSDFTAGEVIGYDSVAHIGNPRFGVHPTGALNIASGKPKATIATVHGNWKKTTPEDAFKLSQTIHNDPQWRQVGMDPERHSYFYDRETQEPVMAADEALHIGPLVYAKNPVYGKKTDFAFSKGGGVDSALALTRRFTKDGAGATMALKPKGK